MFREKLKLLEMDEKLMNRSVNEGFSGGEKKRNEILQMAVLEPKLAILDETDSGLDIDALRIVAKGVNAMRSPERAMLVVTHYQRLLNYIVPDFVHVLVDGRIVRSGGQELALELEEKGYGWMEAEARPRRRAMRDEGQNSGDRSERSWRTYLESFSELREAAAGACLPWLRKLRAGCVRALLRSRASLPLRDEDWRFTNVAAIAQTPFRLARERRSTGFRGASWSRIACRVRPASLFS